MAKGNGTTRAGGSGNPKGLSASGGITVELPYTPSYRYGASEVQAAQNEIEDLEYSIREIQAQQDEITEATERLYREMENDPENTEYYEGQIADFDGTYMELEAQISARRIRIGELEKIIKNNS